MQGTRTFFLILSPHFGSVNSILISCILFFFSCSRSARSRQPSRQLSLKQSRFQEWSVKIFRNRRNVFVEAVAIPIRLIPVYERMRGIYSFIQNKKLSQFLVIYPGFLRYLEELIAERNLCCQIGIFHSISQALRFCCPLS